MSTAVYKLAYLVSHPIQYQAPMLRYIAATPNIDLTVYFLSDFSLRGYSDPGFKATVEWDIPLVGGYKHVVLPAIGANDRLTATRPFVYGIGQHLLRGGFDALWMHGYAHLASLRAMFAAKALGIKVFVRTDTQSTVVSGSPLVKRIKRPAVRRLFQWIDGFLTVGSRNEQYYRSYGVPERKLFSVPYAVDNEFFQERCREASSGREALRAELRLEPNRPVILFASKFQARKRARDLLQAYIGLSPDGQTEPLPYLIFVGDGEERTMLMEQASATGWTSIRFPGFQNQSTLPRYFDLCDVFVLPSAAEPWGLVVNEVMNAGRAVIVTDEVGAAPDLVIDGDNGFVIEVGDIAGLTDRLRRVTSSPDLAASMGAASVRRINDWGFSKDVAGIEEALTAVVRRQAAH